jgi:ADP-heptose:LPS heptosyltransferase
MAAAVGTPAVCILGGGHYGRFLPYQIEKRTTRPLPIAVSYKMDCFGCNWKCAHAKEVKGAMPCVANISVSQVWDEVKKILQASSLIQSQQPIVR